MRKIIFTGHTQNIEFTSKWKRKGNGVDSITKDAGEYLAKYISKVIPKKERVRGVFPKLFKKGEPMELTIGRGRSEVLRKKANIDKTPIIQNTDFKTTNANGKQIISDKGRERLQQLRKNSKKRKSIVLSSIKSNSSKLNKKVIIGAGLLTAGAIGYGLSRKLRNDKGRKRGKYRKQ